MKGYNTTHSMRKSTSLANIFACICQVTAQRKLFLSICFFVLFCGFANGRTYYFNSYSYYGLDLIIHREICIDINKNAKTVTIKMQTAELEWQTAVFSIESKEDETYSTRYNLKYDDKTSYSVTVYKSLTQL